MCNEILLQTFLTVLVLQEKQEQPKMEKKVLVLPEDDEDTKFIKLDDNVVVSVVKFKGEPYIDVRKCFMGAYGKMLYTKKGILLSVGQWKELKKMNGRIKKCLHAMK